MRAIPHSPVAGICMREQQTNPKLAPRPHARLGEKAARVPQADQHSLQRRHPARHARAKSALPRNIHLQPQHACAFQAAASHHIA